MAPPRSPARLAVVNARVWTGDVARPWADAVAVAEDRIVAVGSSAEIRKSLPGSARVIDARGGLLTPGFVDSHIHFLEGGQRLGWVQLAAANTRADFQKRIAAFAAGLRAGEWILGGDWDHERWSGVLPTCDWIDSVTPANPVWVTRHDGHMGLANSLALELAGISELTPDPPGGTITRDAQGAATGIVKDRAMDLVMSAIPAAGAAQEDTALMAAMKYVAERGVTSVHNMGTWENLAVFRRAHDRGELKTRVYAAVPLRTWPRLSEETAANGKGDKWLRIGALKEFVDGSLGSHTALFFDPYNDLPSDRGLLLTPEPELLRMMTAADAAGLHCITHAIGDRANHILLNVYEQVAVANGPRDRRLRIEHAQHLSAADVPRFAAQGVIASMQPYHAIDDGRWAERTIGTQRAQLTYPIRSLLGSGATVAMGSDWFVAPPTPLEGIFAAVTRRTLDGLNPGGWIPEQKVSVTDALRGYTSAAAYAGFEENEKGTITAGKLADMVLIDRDITAIAPDEIASTSVMITIVGGEVVVDKTASH